MDRHFASLFELLSRERENVVGWDSAGEDSGRRAAQVDESMVATAAGRGRQGGQKSQLTRQWLQAESQWWAAVSALTQLLRQALLPLDLASEQVGAESAVLLSGPLPILQEAQLQRWVSSWLFMPQALADMLAVARPMLPFKGTQGDCQNDLLQTIPLTSEQPLGQERFCLVITEQFSLSLVLSRPDSPYPRFRFSFDPEINYQVWLQLRSHIAHGRPALLPRFDALSAQLIWKEPHYRLVSRFSDCLLEQLQLQAATEVDALVSSQETAFMADRQVETVRTERGQGPPPSDRESAADLPGRDAQLLQAMAHEIRTPLTTIRTFTRSLLKRRDLSDDVVRRLHLIDRECTQQIDRFNLIFQAVELEIGAKPPCSPLAPISLTQIFQQAIPTWQQQVQRRGLNLEVNLPAKLPTVTSDPTMLQQVLTGLIERFTQSLPPSSHIDLTVTPAGHQLKLQFQSRTGDDSSPQPVTGTPPMQSIGQLLMFQPETGGVSLNLNATKNLFHALGGKLIVRQKPQSGEVLTVFLPLETRTL